MAKEVRVWLGPEQPAELAAAIEGAGATLTPAAEANAIVWSGGRHPAELLREALHPGIEWVQLDSAGIERWLEADLLDHDRIWTGAQGV